MSLHCCKYPTKTQTNLISHYSYARRVYDYMIWHNMQSLIIPPLSYSAQKCDPFQKTARLHLFPYISAKSPICATNKE